VPKAWGLAGPQDNETTGLTDGETARPSSVVSGPASIGTTLAGLAKKRYSYVGEYARGN